mmetsp:Transcript_50594/g.147068  ORF Transcript_50594/g.147068 Transcript_50594/m.147068 type:complete len:376 (+) Transcript_50594:332-1459(+)
MLLRPCRAAPPRKWLMLFRGAAFAVAGACRRRVRRPMVRMMVAVPRRCPLDGRRGPGRSCRARGLHRLSAEAAEHLPSGLQDVPGLRSSSRFRVSHLDREARELREHIRRLRQQSLISEAAQDRCPLHLRGHGAQELSEHQAQGVHVGGCVDELPGELLWARVRGRADAAAAAAAAAPGPSGRRPRFHRIRRRRRGRQLWRGRRAFTVAFEGLAEHLGETEVPKAHGAGAVAAAEENIRRLHVTVYAVPAVDVLQSPDAIDEDAQGRLRPRGVRRMRGLRAAVGCGLFVPLLDPPLQSLLAAQFDLHVQRRRVLGHRILLTHRCRAARALPPKARAAGIGREAGLPRRRWRQQWHRRHCRQGRRVSQRRGGRRHR